MKTRLTITLSEDILNKIDQLIDKKNIRNRSHAIEHVLSANLQPSISTAVILAGEKDDRDLRCLTIINDKHLIEHTLELLKKHNITRVIVATNHKGKQIQKKVSDGSNYDLNIEYIFEKTPLGTAGAIKNLQTKLGGKPFIVIAGDTLTDINLTDLIEYHNLQKNICTMAVKPRTTQKTYDNVFIQGNRVVDFQPSQDDQTVSLVNAGIYIFEPQIFKYLDNKTPAMLEQTTFPQLSKDKQLSAFTFQGIWFDVEADKNYQTQIEKS